MHYRKVYFFAQTIYFLIKYLLFIIINYNRNIIIKRLILFIVDPDLAYSADDVDQNRVYHSSIK